MIKNWRLVADDAILHDHLPRVLALEAKRRSQGFTVLTRINAQGMSAISLRALLQAGRPAAGDKSYIVLIGDAVPHLYLLVSPDGHAQRDLWACKLFCTKGQMNVDANGRASSPPIDGGRYEVPWGAVSRIQYDKQSMAGVSSSVLYGAKLDQLLTWEDNALAFGTEVDFDDHLYFGMYNGDSFYISMGQRCEAQIPPALLRDYEELPTNAPDGTDGQWSRWAANPVLLGISFSGGYEQFVEGLYYVGTMANWRANRPSAAVGAFWGSYQPDYTRDNNLPMGASTASDTYISVYDYSGYFAFSTFFAGGAIGDASIDTVLQNPNDMATYITDLVGGDCSMALTDPQLAITQMRAQLAAMQTATMPDLSQYVRHADLPDFSQYVTQQAMADQIKQLAAQPVIAAPPMSTPPISTLPLLDNCGGPAIGGWGASSNVVAGSNWSTPGVTAANIVTAGVANAGPADIYATYLTNPTPGQPVRLNFAVGDTAAHTIELHFCESYYKQAGKRPMNVFINDQQVLTAYDPFTAAGGALRAVVAIVSGTTVNGQIAVRVEGVGGAFPLLCAVALR